MGSPSLVRRGKQWWLHTPIEKTFAAPAKVEQQITTNPQTRICAVDLNLDQHIAVCSVQTVEGTILATSFIGNGTEIAGTRALLLGRIARNRSQTGIMAENEQDNADWLRAKSAILMNTSRTWSAAALSSSPRNIRPASWSLSTWAISSQKRGSIRVVAIRSEPTWMKGRIFRYSKYKAWHASGIITSRVNPRNTSRQCHRCHAAVIRYNQGQPE